MPIAGSRQASRPGAEVGRSPDRRPATGLGKKSALAIAYGLGTHALFAAAVTAMAVGLYTGMRSGLGTLRGGPAWAVNALLILQFPICHSLLLSRGGSRFLKRLAPAGLGGPLATTTYAALASAQLLLVFVAWSPAGATLLDPGGATRVILSVAYAGSWLFLARALVDGGLALQTGYLGWSSVVRGRSPYPIAMPTAGLFRLSRQPIYFGFALVLWTAPVWTTDRLALVLAWTAYCLIGPLFKEARFRERYGEEFARYRERVPYWLPALRRPRP